MLIHGKLMSVGYNHTFARSTIKITVEPGGYDYEMIVSDEKAVQFAKILYSQVSVELRDPIVMQIELVGPGKQIS